MPMGINNITVITMNNITEISNSSSMAEFMVKGNEIMFGGIAFFWGSVGVLIFFNLRMLFILGSSWLKIDSISFFGNIVLFLLFSLFKNN